MMNTEIHPDEMPSLFAFEIRHPNLNLPATCSLRGTDKAHEAAQTLVSAAVEDKNETFATAIGIRAFHERVACGQYVVPEDVHTRFCPEFEG